MSERRRLFGVLLASLLVASVLLTPCSGLAHPMGNFSISHYAGLTLEATEIELHYLIDMAEIPTLQELQDSGLTPEAAPSIRDGYLARKAESLKDNLYLEVNGERLVLVTSARDLLFSPGAGGLPDHGDASCVASCPLSGRQLPRACRLERSRGGVRPRRRAGE